MLFLDSSHCPRADSDWTRLTAFVTRLIYTPIPGWAKVLLALALLSGAIALGWLAYRRQWWHKLENLRWSRRWTKRLVILIIGILVLVSPPSLDLALGLLRLPIPPDPGTAADAVVVLGRSRRLGDRVHRAEQLWRQQRAPLLFASGASTRPINAWLRAGVPDTAVGGEVCSLTTYENALFTAQVLPPTQYPTIILVTDPPHMWRSRLTFQHQGFEVLAHPTTLPDDLGYREKFVLVLREYSGLVAYAIKGRLAPASESS